MSKEKENKMVPRLRFPEFREDDEWELKTFESICLSISSGKDKIEDDGEYDLYGSTGIIGKTSYSSYDGNFILVARVGANAGYLNKVNGRFGVTDNTLVIILKDSENLNFIYNTLDNFGLNRLVFGSGQPLITGGQLKSLQIYLPKISEQQKIASCLSSLDELITAHSQKLEALKAHKKGLMQQLFPAEGKTVPKLRFEEFRESGEWEEKTLGQCLLRHPEYGINAPAVPFSENLPKYLRITDISEEGYYLRNQIVSVEKDVTEENYLENGDIVLARTGASVGKSYKYRPEDGRLVFAGFLIRVKPNEEKLNSELLFQYLSSVRYWIWVSFISARSGQPGINGNEYSSMPITLPPTIKEQQKIASCLSSLDEWISAQGQKIEALKAHKKGLMQGLFPNADSASDIGGNNGDDIRGNDGDGDGDGDGDDIGDDIGDGIGDGIGDVQTLHATSLPKSPKSPQNPE